MNAEVLDAPAATRLATDMGAGAAQPVTVREQTAIVAPPQSSDMAAVMAYAMQRGATAADLRALMELKVQADNHALSMLKERRAMDVEDRAAAAKEAFRVAFAAFRGENVTIPKTKTVDRGKAGSFRHAEFDVMCRMLSPALSKHGFSFRHDQVFGSKRWMSDGVESDIPWVYVTCFLERGGHSERLDLEGPPGDTPANTPVQNMQVTASVLKRQSLAAITGTATGGEDDENALRRRQDGGSSTEIGTGAQDGGNAAAARALLIDQGQEKATQGMKMLTAWWGALTEKQRSSITPEFGTMRAAAKQFDQVGK